MLFRSLLNNEEMWSNNCYEMNKNPEGCLWCRPMAGTMLFHLRRHFWRLMIWLGVARCDTWVPAMSQAGSCNRLWICPRSWDWMPIFLFRFMELFFFPNPINLKLMTYAIEMSDSSVDMCEYFLILKLIDKGYDNNLQHQHKVIRIFSEFANTMNSHKKLSLRLWCWNICCKWKMPEL